MYERERERVVFFGVSLLFLHRKGKRKMSTVFKSKERRKTKNGKTTL